ncbi:MAG: hypothetical protein AB7F59_11365 [Bdellovibrionales bacterium]
MTRLFVVLFAILHISVASHAQTEEEVMLDTVKKFSDGLSEISEMQKAKRPKAEQVAAICPLVFNFFDMTYIHSEYLIWLKHENPNSDVLTLDPVQQQKLIVAYFAVHVMKQLDPLFDALAANPYEFTFIEARLPKDKKVQKYTQHSREIIFKFRDQADARAFIAFMTPGLKSLIRTATVDDMYGQNTLTSASARTLNGRNADQLKAEIAKYTKNALTVCP